MEMFNKYISFYAGLPRNRRESLTPDLYFTSPRLSLLLKWCRAVCAYYNMKV